MVTVRSPAPEPAYPPHRSRCSRARRPRADLSARPPVLPAPIHCRSAARADLHPVSAVRAACVNHPSPPPRPARAECASRPPPVLTACAARPDPLSARRPCCPRPPPGPVLAACVSRVEQCPGPPTGGRSFRLILTNARFHARIVPVCACGNEDKWLAMSRYMRRSPRWQGMGAVGGCLAGLVRADAAARSSACQAEARFRARRGTGYGAGARLLRCEGRAVTAGAGAGRTRAPGMAGSRALNWEDATGGAAPGLVGRSGNGHRWMYLRTDRNIAETIVFSGSRTVLAA
jgi:hypothetical protein